MTAQRLGAEPEQCLVFEDLISGIKAALAAGMSVVAVPDAVMDKGLYWVVQDILLTLTDFLPSSWDLPKLISGMMDEVSRE